MTEPPNRAVPNRDQKTLRAHGGQSQDALDCRIEINALRLECGDIHRSQRFGLGAALTMHAGRLTQQNIQRQIHREGICALEHERLVLSRRSDHSKWTSFAFTDRLEER